MTPNGNQKILEESSEIVILVEPNILGINETRKILKEVMKNTKNQKDKIKIAFNKTNFYSIRKDILKIMFSDFEILGMITQKNFYNVIINTNLKIVNKKTKKEYREIIKKLER